MALKAEIEAIVASMTDKPGFLFGDVNELNTLADDIETTEFTEDNNVVKLKPFVFMFALQPVNNNFTNNNSINNTYDIYLEFLFKIEFDTYTWQCEPLDVAATKLVNEFLIRLKDFRGPNGGRMFKINVGDKTRSQQVFNKYDLNTVGRNLTMTLETLYNEKLCL